MSENAGTVQRLRSADGTTIAWESYGSGPVLVLVTGATADRSANADFVATFADTYRVISYDRRGRGDSAAPPGYSREAEVADLAALIAAVGGSATLLGVSSGAALALHAAAADIGVTGVLGWEPPFELDAEAPRRAATYRARLGELLDTGRNGDAVDLFMVDRAGVPAELVGGMHEMPMWPALEANAPSLRGDAAVMGDTGVPTAVLDRITVPTVVADGGQTPWLSAGAEAAAVGRVRHRRVDGQGHGPEAAALVDVLTSVTER